MSVKINEFSLEVFGEQDRNDLSAPPNYTLYVSVDDNIQLTINIGNYQDLNGLEKLLIRMVHKGMSWEEIKAYLEL